MRSANTDPPTDLRRPAPDSDTALSSGTLDGAARARLLEIARQSIAHGLEQGKPLPVLLDEEPAPLRATGAAFVTLTQAGNLRGCIGHLEAIAPLAVDTAENAFAAAFRDPRFPALTVDELEGLKLEVSVLTPPEPIAFETEAELLAAIEPGVDGLILTDGGRRGTFLPSVWSQLPTREEFLRHLKQKAGLSPEHWSPQLRVSRYRTESFSE
jgi:AmmeMemoRadiSam system protein A